MQSTLGWDWSYDNDDSVTSQVTRQGGHSIGSGERRGQWEQKDRRTGC